MRRSCGRETHASAIAQSLQWLDDRRITVQFPVRGKRRFSSPKRPDGLWDPAYHSTGTAGLFHDGKAVGAWSWPLTSRAEVKNGWRYTSTSPYAFMACTAALFTFLIWDSKAFVARNKQGLHHLSRRAALPLACWYLGFESHRGHEYLSVVSVVCCQVEVSATSWSLVQRTPTDCAASLCVI